MLDQGYWIMPNKVLYSKELTDKQKLLYCLISSLCAEKGYCRAKNEYMAEKLWTTTRTIREHVSELEEKWFITVELKNNNERFIRLAEGEEENFQGGGRKFPGGEEENFHPYIYKNNTSEYTAEKKSDIPTPSELVEAYRNTPQLVEKIKDEWAVRQRAEYKQKKKSKAYKTINWFIQQLVENVTTVSFGEIRYDVWDRLRYAQNKAIDWDNQWIRRDDRMEKWFNNWKKFNSLSQKQNEWQSS